LDLGWLRFRRKGRRKKKYFLLSFLPLMTSGFLKGGGDIFLQITKMPLS
jgi:hypothetical protein